MTIKGIIDGIRPIKRLPPSQWAEEKRVLGSASNDPGPWRNSRTPYLVEIMDCFQPNSPVQTVVFMKGSQIGATEAGFNVLGFYIDRAPCTIMYVMPTEGTVKRNSKMRFDPMVNASPSLKAKIAPARTRDKENSVLQKSFPGGTVIFCGANSPAPLRSIPVKVIILDEVDAMPLSVENEGDPIELAKARTRTFPNRKIAIISTPTKSGTSIIEREYLNTAQRRYFVPCPECGLFQTLEFEKMKWTPGEPWTVRHICDGCGYGMQETDKPFLLGNGEWRDTAPENKSAKRVGFHLSALYSPFGWYSWEEAIEDHERTENSEEKRQVFMNTVLGETYSPPGEAPQWEKLFERRENYPDYCPPQNVIILTAGVDVQADRLEVEIVGWCQGKESYSIDYRVLMGDTSNTAPGSVWDQLERIVFETWKREDNRVLWLSKMAIDSGFNTNEVYTFCRRFDPQKVFPIKGRDSYGIAIGGARPVDVLDINRKPIGRLALWSVGSSLLKSEFYGWLRLPRNDDGTFPPGYCHFPTAYGEEYFKMLTAERHEKVVKKGYAVYEWVKIRNRNEALDCRVYARAASYLVGIDRWSPEDWAAADRMYQAGGTEPQRKKRPKSDFW